LYHNVKLTDPAEYFLVFGYIVEVSINKKSALRSVKFVNRDGLSILATLCKQKFGGPRPWSPRISASQSV